MKINFIFNLFDVIDLEGKIQSIHNWQKIIFNIPNDKLILSIKKTHQSFIPTLIQALVIVHQRLDGMKSISFIQKLESVFFS